MAKSLLVVRSSSQSTAPPVHIGLRRWLKGYVEDLAGESAATPGKGATGKQVRRHGRGVFSKHEREREGGGAEGKRERRDAENIIS